MNVLHMEADMAPLLGRKLTMSVRVALWIRKTGSGPATHVRANSEPAENQARLVLPHAHTSLAHWNPSRAGLASQAPTCKGTLILPLLLSSTREIGTRR
jgi:hypothetical protein